MVCKMWRLHHEDEREPHFIFKYKVAMLQQNGMLWGDILPHCKVWLTLCPGCGVNPNDTNRKLLFTSKRKHERMKPNEELYV